MTESMEENILLCSLLYCNSHKKYFQGSLLMDAVLFYFYLMRNAFSRIHPHISSLLILGPYVLGGFHVITKKG